MHKSALIIAFAFLIAGIGSSSIQSKSFTDRSSGSQRRAQKRTAHSSRINCLPPGTSLDEVVSYGTNDSGNVTVAKKLAKLNARCRNRKLLDAKGREIRFHRPSCWGNPPADYQEIQEQENKDLLNLRKRYTVIVFGCNPMIQ